MGRPVWGGQPLGTSLILPLAYALPREKAFPPYTPVPPRRGPLYLWSALSRERRKTKQGRTLGTEVELVPLWKN